MNDLTKLFLYADDRQNLFACELPPEGMERDIEKAEDYQKTWQWVVNLNSVAPEWRNMFKAALLMYNVLDRHQQLLDSLIEILEQHDGDALVGSLQEAMATFSNVKRVAVEGINIVP